MGTAEVATHKLLRELSDAELRFESGDPITCDGLLWLTPDDDGSALQWITEHYTDDFELQRASDGTSWRGVVDAPYSLPFDFDALFRPAALVATGEHLSLIQIVRSTLYRPPAVFGTAVFGVSRFGDARGSQLIEVEGFGSPPSILAAPTPSGPQSASSTTIATTDARAIRIASIDVVISAAQGVLNREREYPWIRAAMHSLIGNLESLKLLEELAAPRGRFESAFHRLLSFHEELHPILRAGTDYALLSALRILLHQYGLQIP